MCTHKPDEHITHYKLYYYNKPVFVSPDIEHIMLIANRVDITEIRFDIRK